jgi:hypothetical protein
VRKVVPQCGSFDVAGVGLWSNARARHPGRLHFARLWGSLRFAAMADRPIHAGSHGRCCKSA